MKLKKKYFGVISNGTLRKYFNYDTVQEIIDAHEKHYKNSYNTMIGIIDLETDEFVYPVDIDDSKIQAKRDVINNVYNSITQA